jgi:ribosomal protein S6--L-glutamate ligase
MKVGILGWDDAETESTGLAAAARDLGHQAVLFVLDDIGCRPAASGLVPTVRGEPAERLDVIVSRAHLRPGSWQADCRRLTLLSNLASVPVIDPVWSFTTTKDKFLEMQVLGAAGLPVPPTRSCRTIAEVDAAVGDWDTVVLKPCGGWGGTDVERTSDASRDEPMIAGLLAAHGELVCQPYLAHPDGDIRITVIGDSVVGAFARRPAAGGWKSNVSQGAAAIPLPDPPAELADLGRRAARALSLRIAGVDIIQAADGPVILEINGCPGWSALPPPTRCEVTAEIIALAERTARDQARRPAAGRHRW